jgi:hypothetical protein
LITLALLACAPEVAVYERPVVVASAREIDFGWVASGDVVQRTLALRNDGELPFGVGSVELWDDDRALGGGFWVEAPAPGTLVTPGEELAMGVWFAPEAAENESEILVRFYEDESTAWHDRAHPWMGIRLRGAGAGLPADPDASPMRGGIVPAQVGIEEGDQVVLTARPGPDVVSEWAMWPDRGVVAASDPFDLVYVAPDPLPAAAADPWEEIGPPPADVPYRVRFSYMATDANGSQTWDTVDVQVWSPGELRAPVVVVEEP